MSHSARLVHYAGKVQGVGFRYTVKRLATGYEVRGSIRNLSDGRVELRVASREPEELDAFLLAIRESPLASHIQSETPMALEAASIPQRGFEISSDGL